jgi:glycosyltransferase involved in cell wall biosynthesis
MHKSKTAFVSFFSIFPDTNGSASMTNSRFKNWPSKKKLFQLSHIKKKNTKNVCSIFIGKETPMNKIFRLPKIIYKIFSYLKNEKKNQIVIIEGSSWIFYTFIVFFTLRILLPKSKIIYISHNVESEIRKDFSNKFIYLLTKTLEKIVFKYSCISTVVSPQDKKKIKKLYNLDTIIYPNAISLNYKINKNKLKDDYIIYSGSYFFKPNRDAIDYLNKHIMPQLIKKIPNIKLLLTGGGLTKNYPWIINKGIVSKNNLYNLIYHSKLMCVPLNFGSGTRIKIIESLSIGAIVLSTKKGIEGIKLKNINPPFVTVNRKNFVKKIFKIIKNNRTFKSRSFQDKAYYQNTYSMKTVTKNFIKNYLN